MAEDSGQHGSETDSSRRGRPGEVDLRTRRASWGPRLAAFSVDLVLPAAVVAVLAFVGTLTDRFPRPTAFPTIVAFVAFILVGAAVLSSIASWLSDGQSVGKAIFGLEVRRSKRQEWNGRLSVLWWAFARASIGYGVIDCLGIGAIGALSGRYRRAAHDLVFSSQVVAVNREQVRRARNFGELVDVRVKEFERRRTRGVERYQQQYGHYASVIKMVNKVVGAVIVVFAGIIVLVFGFAPTAGAATTTAGTGGVSVAPAASGATQLAVTAAGIVVTVGVLAAPQLVPAPEVGASVLHGGIEYTLTASRCGRFHRAQTNPSARTRTLTPIMSFFS